MALATEFQTSGVGKDGQRVIRIQVERSFDGPLRFIRIRPVKNLRAEEVDLRLARHVSHGKVHLPGGSADKGWILLGGFMRALRLLGVGRALRCMAEGATPRKKEGGARQRACSQRGSNRDSMDQCWFQCSSVYW